MRLLILEYWIGYTQTITYDLPRKQNKLCIFDIFSKTEQYLLLLDKLLPDSVMASSRSEENVVLNNFQHKRCIQCWYTLMILFGYFDKIIRVYQHWYTFCVGNWFRTTFSSDLEEAMTESGKSLSNSNKYCSVLEKLSKINDVKQNEKHPFRNKLWTCVSTFISLLQSYYYYIFKWANHANTNTMA